MSIALKLIYYENIKRTASAKLGKAVKTVFFA